MEDRVTEESWRIVSGAVVVQADFAARAAVCEVVADVVAADVVAVDVVAVDAVAVDAVAVEAVVDATVADG